MFKNLGYLLMCGVMLTMWGCAGGPGLERPLDPNTLDATGDLSDGKTSPPMVPVYYNSDSSGIRADQTARLDYNAAFIKGIENPVVLEGNTDPRGTKEYNIALGERRAQAAKKYLIIMGVDPAQLSTMSFGEENLDTDNPEDYVLNRRTDFVVQ